MATGISGVTKTDELVETAVVSILNSVVPVGMTALPREALSVAVPSTFIFSVVTSLAASVPVAVMLP